MPKGFWVKTGVSQIFDDVRNFYVKTGISGWAQVTDAWVKTGLSTWSKFWEALMAPTNTVELLESYTGTDSATLRLQGKNYKWVPTPQTLKYYFRWIPEGGSTYYIGASGSSGDTTSNPVTSTILPGTSSYITISPSGSNFELGKINRYYFEVRATGASGSVYSSISQEDVKIVSPKAPTLSFTVLSSTSVSITITAASFDDYVATNRYILYTYDNTAGFVYSGGGRGGFSVSQITTRTLTGLVSGRNYTVYVLPVTGFSGTTPSNYSGYPGIEAFLSNVTTGSSDPEAFTTISFTKGFPSSSSQGVVRSTALSWNASTNATRYEIEYEGSNDNSNWTNVQTFSASPYTTSTSQSASWGSPQPVGGYGYYYFMRARVRASNPDSAITVIGDSGAYRYATGSPPGQPSFGTITTTSTTASIPVTASSTQGSNYRYEVMEYQYRTSFGSYPGSWSTQSLSSGSGTISLTGLTSSTTYYIKIRNRNFDEEYSSENETTFATSAALTKLATPTGVSATDTRTDGVNVTWNPVTGAAYYGVWYGSAPGYDSLADFGGNRNINLIVHPTTSYLDTSLANGVTRDYYVQAYRSGDPTGTKSEWGGPDSGTRAVEGTAPSGGSVTLSPSGTQQAGTTITANVSAMSGTATISYTTTIRKKTGSAPTSNTDGTQVASGTGTGNVASHTITDSEASGTPDQFRAFTTGTNSFGNNTVASNTVVSTPFVPTQYTISWNANGGSVSPTSNTVNSGTTVSAPTPTRSGFTFLYWRDSPSAFSYIYQINPGGSWTVTSNITFYAYWQASATAPSTPTGVSVSGSGLVSWNAVSGADTYEVLNYTDRTGSPTNTTNRLGPYTTTGITGTSFQLGSSQGYSSPNNWARAQVRARNTAGVSTYSAWFPSDTTYV
jgi:hypothetical protein